MVVRKMWRKDFRCSECKLQHDVPESFTRSFWQTDERVIPIWVIYRTVIALYFIITWSLTIFNVGRSVNDEDAIKYFIFLTNWTYTLETFHFVVAMAIVASRAYKEKTPNYETPDSMETMPCCYQFYWSLHTISLSASISVTCIFWAAVYDPELIPLDFINFATHVFNSVFMVLDFILVGHPFRIAHIYWPIVYALIYILFSLIYQLSGGTGTNGKIPIYGILDWDKPGRTIVTCILAQIFLMFVHLLFWLLYKVKVVTKKKQSNSSGGKKQKEGIENFGMDIPTV